MQQALAKQAIASIDTRSFYLSELPELVRRLKHESQTGQVLIAASYLEDRVKELISFQLKDVGSKKKAELVFGSNAPLSTFGSRLTMSYQLKWLSEEALKQVTAFRKIRNEFAHRAYRASYEDADIKKLFVPLESSLAGFIEKFRPTITEAYQHGHRDFDDLNNEERKICSIALLVTFICVDLLVRPEALKRGISGGRLLTDKAFRPHSVTQMFSNMIRAVFAILEEPGPNSSG